MIFNLLINAILLVLGVVFSILPEVSLASIPFIGDNIVSVLTFAILKWNVFLATFPYGVVAWETFKWVIIPFELLMIVGKFFLGSRMPHNEVR